jgi:hypothetical protein
VTTAPPITKLIKKTKTYDIFISGFLCEFPIDSFVQGFEHGTKIRVISSRKDMHKAIPGVHTGKLIMRVLASQAHSVPEMFKVHGFLVTYWFNNCNLTRPCPICSKIGHNKWECPTQNRENTPTPMIRDNSLTNTHPNDTQHTYANITAGNTSKDTRVKIIK